MSVEYGAWPVDQDTKCAGCGAIIKKGELELQWQEDGWAFIRGDKEWHPCGCVKCDPAKVEKYA